MRRKNWKKRLRIITILLALLLVSVVIFRLLDSEQISEPVEVTIEIPRKIEPNPELENVLENFESHILSHLKHTKTPGVAIAIIKDTSVVYLRGIGIREMGKPDSIDEHSVFRLASVSKCFAPILTGLLVEDSILQWDDPVIKHVPDFSLKSEEYTNSLTLRHVLSHTTGLPYHTYTNMIEEGMSLKQMLDMLKNVTLTGPPGEVYSYQNVGYSIIAEVIRSATGKSYEQLMRERVFEPLKMSDASLSYNEILSNNNIAHPHLLWRKGWRVTSINDTYYNASPAGGVNASISDMAQFLKALVKNDGALISQNTLAEIFSPVIPARSKNRNFRKWLGTANAHYGLGWRVLQFKNDTLMYHGGYVNGYRSEVAIHQKNKIAICVLSNGPGNVVDNAVPYFFKLYFDKRHLIDKWYQNHVREQMQKDILKR